MNQKLENIEKQVESRVKQEKKEHYKLSELEIFEQSIIELDDFLKLDLPEAEYIMYPLIQPGTLGMIYG